MSTIGKGSAEPELAGNFVDFVTTGERVKGEYHCSECGYGVTVHSVLPRCPMCGGEAWEQTEWHPFSRTHAALH